MERIHLDHNATTPLRPEVRELWLAELDRLRGNPSSVHAGGRAARAVLDDARERVAAALGVHEDEILFTSSGTEANNLAILGAMRALGAGHGVVTSAIEHSSVLAPVRELAAAGHATREIGVDAHGRIDADEVIEAAASGDVGLVSVMAANNEVGSLGPLARIGAGLRARDARALFHTDAVQALGRIPVRLSEWGVALASFSAHKVGGPLGVGFLYKRRDVRLAPILHGGGQESGLRPGTENAPAAAAAALALELAVGEQHEFATRARELSRSFWEQVQAVLPGARLLGPPLDTRSSLLGTPSPALETRSPALETRSPELDTRSPELDTHSPSLDTHSPSLDSRSPSLDSRSPSLDSRSPSLDTRSPALGADDRLPNTLNIALEGIDSRVLVARLDLEGLEVSAGSACASGSLEPSHVLIAMGLSREVARAGLRISIGRTTTARDIHMAVEILRTTFWIAR
jgi:cysteine desulfurase